MRPKSAIELIWKVVLLIIVMLDSHSMMTLVPPKLIPMPKSAQLRKGERYHVTCSTSDGSPPLTFSWSKNGETLESDGNNAHSDIIVRRLDDFSTSLVVENVHENHTGNYSCTASNPAGRDAGTTSLQVLFPPSWIRAPTDVSVQAGNKISLSCEVAGSPKPTVTWRRNSDFSAMNFGLIHSDGQIRLTNDGQNLQISESKKQDEGFYECHVSNGVGDPLRKTIRIEVQVPPKVSDGQSEVIVKKGNEVTIKCDMSGDLPLGILWEQNGKVLEQKKSRIKIQEIPTDIGVSTSLILSAVDRGNSGLYTCKVKNAYGERYRIINVDVVEHPSPPLDVAVSQVWSRSLQVTWTTPYGGNRPIAAYLIYFWKTEGKNEPPPEKPRVLRITTLQTNAIVPNLLPNSNYGLYMITENEVGQSGSSETVVGTTREEEPDWSPAEVTSLEKHATSVSLKWKCPLGREWIATLKGYYVGYKRTNTKAAYTYRILLENECKSNQEYVLRGLQEASSYMIVVKSFNSVGVGPPSEQIIVHTANGGQPRTPLMKLLSTAGVTCNLKIWPTETTKNYPTAFALYIAEVEGEWQKIYVPVLASRNYSIGGLRLNTQYDIYVKAKNEFGESMASSTMRIRTEQTDPNTTELNVPPNYDKIYFILPIVVSSLTVIVLPLLACYCLQRSTSRQMQADSIEVRDFIYNAATIARIDATLRRASASGTLRHARMESMPRQPRTGRVETTTLPTPDPPQQVIVEPAPCLPTSYSTLQNYGTAATATESELSPTTETESKPPSPPMEDTRYDSVVEEMRNLIKEGSRAKKAVSEEYLEESS